MRRWVGWCVGVSVAVSVATVGYTEDAVRATRQWRQTHERELIQSYIEMLRTPNITRDLPNVLDPGRTEEEGRLRLAAIDGGDRLLAQQRVRDAAGPGPRLPRKSWAMTTDGGADVGGGPTGVDARTRRSRTRTSTGFASQPGNAASWIDPMTSGYSRTVTK